MNKETPLSSIFPACRRVLGSDFPDNGAVAPVDFPSLLSESSAIMERYPHIKDLAEIEWVRHTMEEAADFRDAVEEACVNPTLQLLEVEWRHLPDFFKQESPSPVAGEDLILVWKEAETGNLHCESASHHDLLALKIVTEKLDPKRAAAAGNVSIGTIDDILYNATHKGLLLSPPSRIRRPDDFHRGDVADNQFFSSPVFTLQWHITQKCDLHCKHCYDRSERRTLGRDRALRILDDLYDFCRLHHVYGQISFTGGNPLLYPHFNEVYREAAERGFLTAILGNPMPRHRIEELLDIQKPEFYQVSLEGLREHTDYIRGRGHFDRVLTFLELLRELKIYSMVMLTLTRANMDQVIELAEFLKERVDLFTFNRLSMVGEGAALASAPVEEFPRFLEKYLQMAEHNPAAALKDNFFNIFHLKNRKPFFGGCAGFGCGAAFNFVSLLPDGRVDACRKFPSPIGNIFEKSLNAIYHGEKAAQYRRGSIGCSDCRIRPVCGGCLAVTHGFGLDELQVRDPYCFIDRLL